MNILFQPLRQQVCSSCTNLRRQKKKLQRQIRCLKTKLSTNQSTWAETIENMITRAEVISTGQCYIVVQKSRHLTLHLHRQYLFKTTYLSESQTDEIVILDNSEADPDKQMDCFEACIDDDDKGTEEEKGHLHV